MKASRDDDGKRPDYEHEVRLVVILLALALDLLLGEPRGVFHPVTWIGAAIDRLESASPAPGRRLNLAYGLISAAGLSAVVATAALATSRATRHLPSPLRLLLLAVSLKPAFAVRMLLSAAGDVKRGLDKNDLASARRSLCNLVSRDTEDLTAPECAAAAIESLAENTTDSIVGPLLAYEVFGLPGAWAFRTLNTLDSRWGYHGRYELLGRAAALLDDGAAYVPARLSAILLIAGTAVTGGSARTAIRAVMRDRACTSSPNAGWTMSVMAGGLGRRLEKRGEYTLNGDSAPCSASDIRRAQGTVCAAMAIALAAAAACAGVSRSRRANVLSLDSQPAR